MFKLVRIIGLGVAVVAGAVEAEELDAPTHVMLRFEAAPMHGGLYWDIRDERGVPVALGLVAPPWALQVQSDRHYSVMISNVETGALETFDIHVGTKNVTYRINLGAPKGLDHNH